MRIILLPRTGCATNADVRRNESDIEDETMPYIKFSVKLICVSSILTLSTAFANGLKEGVGRSDQEIEVETGVIFSEKVSELNELCSRPSGCWLPKPVDIVDLEKNMPRYLLLSKEPGASEISKNLAAYKRKYFGYKKKGERWILVIGLCSKYWRRDGGTFQTVKRPMTDMGTCYFSGEYNVENRKFMDFYIDGEA
jgi:hypothetical protein